MFARTVIVPVIKLVNITRLDGEHFVYLVTGPEKETISFKIRLLIRQEYFIEGSDIEGLRTYFFIIDGNSGIQAVTEAVAKTGFEPALFNTVTMFEFDPFEIMIHRQLLPETGFIG